MRESSPEMQHVVSRVTHPGEGSAGRPLSWGNVPVTSRAPHHWGCLLLRLLLKFISSHILAQSPEASFQEESVEPPNFIFFFFPACLRNNHRR